MNGWTPERKQRQREAIQRWKPWEQSTGPKTTEGKSVVSRNGYKGGMRPLIREVSKTHRAIKRLILEKTQ